MKKLLLLTLSLLLTLPTYASEKVFGNLEVESSLSVHDTADPIVFIVDSGTHRVGINVDSPSIPPTSNKCFGLAVPIPTLSS